MPPDQRGVAPRFASDDGRVQSAPMSASSAAGSACAVVDPDAQSRKLFANAKRGEILAVALDRLEIGDIEGGNG